MTTRLTPYLTFRGEAREALDHYQSILGGTVEVMTYADMGGMEEMGIPADRAGWVMHGSLDVSEGVYLMASDDARPVEEEIHNGQVALAGWDAADQPRMREAFDRLAAGGEVYMPFEQAPWGDWFGQLRDKYGVTWMVDVNGGGDDAA
ncbi:VOC family protein [Nocardioides sp. AE5]|uniref:VOC family protein n=1 Tax=Nocardioides sp. AE5 TaxID=2962573 RepID=UPI00288295CE|nr:VOC family protein [Nocardioides sp. AE5]MDT0203472.1 VOC family protein [Nocardioides sp. AE5]